MTERKLTVRDAVCKPLRIESLEARRPSRNVGVGQPIEFMRPIPFGIDQTLSIPKGFEQGVLGRIVSTRGSTDAR
ncbi:MAG: hypothetical protein AAF797_06395 [Planctomycetota bacterium]